jgi:hypothetical protein
VIVVSVEVAIYLGPLSWPGFAMIVEQVAGPFRLRQTNAYLEGIAACINARQKCLRWS